MANIKKRLGANIEGDFYVDETCIDCGTCRWIAPSVYNKYDDKSRVYAQPETDDEKLAALKAFVACPTFSIGTVEKHPMKPVREAFPDPITDNVFHCGFHSEASFGAASYLIQRPQGNIMIDSPRWIKPLVRKIEEMGGIQYMFFSHKDDVADHQRYRDHFECTRVIHKDDVTADTASMEMLIEGTAVVELDEDCKLLPVPGHTRGSMVLIYKNKFLFSGDHVAWHIPAKRVYAFRTACWYNWDELAKSMERLKDFEFQWILPGHSAPCHFPQKEMTEQMAQCIDWMKTSDDIMKYA